jgi:hypothetical protein
LISKNETESPKKEENIESSKSLDFKASYISFHIKSNDLVEKKIDENKSKFRFFIGFILFHLNLINIKADEQPLKIRPSFGSKTK